MIVVPGFEGRKVAVLGLARSGRAAATALAAGGAEVLAWDDSDNTRVAVAGDVSLTDPVTIDWREVAALMLSPGIPHSFPEPHWAVEAARLAGVEILGDIELLGRAQPEARFIGITGTNGKSTTTALAAHLLRQAGRDVQLGGNIGVPILDLEPPGVERAHVIECSSFQIDLAPSIDPTIGALLNLTPDHLDRHGTMQNYAAIKERLVAEAKVALIGVDDEFCRAIVARLRARQDPTPERLVAISAGAEPSADVFVEGGKIVLRGEGHKETFIALAGARALRGAHNAQNAAFAAAVAREFGLSAGEIGRGLASFPGLPHRMEEVGRIGRTIFVNDSKATNADAAEKALLSFSDIFWIAGGKAKEGGLEPLRALFPRIAKAYLIGAASEAFAATLAGSVAFERSGTLEAATAAAARDASASAAPEPVVLLSPACASYDQFANFEARGEKFRSLVQDLIAAQNGAEAHV
jgi:UDP-N-acetylmuramoylalanine--D-glutamate ligase